LRVYQHEETSPTSGPTASIVLVAYLDRKENGEQISTAEGWPKEGIVSVEGDGGPVETEIEAKVDGLVKIGMDFECLIKMPKKKNRWTITGNNIKGTIM